MTTNLSLPQQEQTINIDEGCVGNSAPDLPAASAALLAEYLTSCGGKAKPEIEQVALRIIERIGDQKWLEAASRVHLVRDEATLEKFCSDTRAELDDQLEPKLAAPDRG